MCLNFSKWQNIKCTMRILFTLIHSTPIAPKKRTPIWRCVPIHISRLPECKLTAGQGSGSADQLAYSFHKDLAFHRFSDVVSSAGSQTADFCCAVRFRREYDHWNTFKPFV